jgi:UDP-glucose 4-epimerase
VLEVAAGRRDAVQVYGTDHPTRDGSAVRDYIHVEDLGRAHLLALYAAEPGRPGIYNLGNGAGFSVLVASSRLIAHELGWAPRSPS